MGRLTNHFDYCDFAECVYRNAEISKKNQCDFFNMTSRDKCHDKKVYEKLREYEDLEEQGLLLKLPCKVGDTVYCFDYPRTDVVVVVEDAVEKIEIWENGMSIETGWDIYRANDLGKTVFLTKAEAEKALAEMKG